MTAAAIERAATTSANTHADEVLPTEISRPYRPAIIKETRICEARNVSRNIAATIPPGGEVRWEVDFWTIVVLGWWLSKTLAKQSGCEKLV